MTDLTKPLRAIVGPSTLPAPELPPPTLSAPGQRDVVIPGYEILGELGRGGVGVVYKARHLSLNRVVALKVLLGGSLAGPVERARFRMEAEAVARLHHQNIVQVYDVGEHGSVPYIALEFVDGPTVRRWQAGMPVDPRVAAGLAARVARAVQHAHDEGIVHRDLKPANIMLTGVGGGDSVTRENSAEQTPRSSPIALLSGSPLPVPKVTDFGLAKAIEGGADLTGTGMACGTPNYMAPEQVQGGSRSGRPAVDVWGLGAVLFELLTGRPPFEGTDAVSVMQHILGNEPPAVRSLTPNVPHDLAVVVGKCLEKNPARRYLTAAAVADDLDRFVAGKPIQARPVGPARRAARWVGRNPVPAALGAALLVGLAGTSAFAAALLRSADRERVAREDETRQREQADAATRAAEAALAEARAERDRAGAALAAARAEQDRAEANLATARRAADGVLGALVAHRTEDPAVYQLYRKVLVGLEPVYREYLGQKTGDPGARAEQAALAEKLGSVEDNLGSWRAARDYYLRAADAYRRLSAEQPDEHTHRRHLGHCLVKAGFATRELGDPDGTRLVREGVAELTAFLAERPDDVPGLDAMIRARLALSGTTEVPTTEHDEAVLALLRRREALTGPHPWVDQIRAHALNNIAVFLDRQGKTGEAEVHWQQVLAIREAQARDHTRSKVVRYELARCLYNYANHLARADRGAEEFDARVRASGLFADLRDDLRQRGHYVSTAVRNCQTLADLCSRRGNRTAAVAQLGLAIDLQAAAEAKNPGVESFRATLADLYTSRAKVLAAGGRYGPAAEDYRAAVRFSTHPAHADLCAARLFVVLVRAGDHAAAARHAATLDVRTGASVQACLEAARGWALLAASAALPPDDRERAAGNARAAIEAAGERGYFDDPDRVRVFHSQKDFQPVWDAVPRAPDRPNPPAPR